MQVLKHLFGSSEPCEHVPESDSVPVAQANLCQECGSGFNIRLCATCGHVGCCDSQARHAPKHASETGHPVIYATPRGDGFTWCYSHNRYL
ncbi:MAG: UBP-type zinc finger domain-containing protein [Chloroflexota bacterium]|nr:UBP-type zinc finger domain-containing protein [Chloroflexota bacterium]